MAWIDYKKAFEFVPHSWFNEFMKFFGVTQLTADNVENFLEKSMEKRKLSLTFNGEDLSKVDVKRKLFQGDILFTTAVCF